MGEISEVNADALRDALGRLGEGRVLVVGDVMLDRYWHGRAERISPEAPVPVVPVDTIEERIGGAGNVAHNITALGGQCTLLAVVGDDEAGREIDEIAGERNIARQLLVDARGQTTVKLRILSRNQQLLRVDFEAPPAASVVRTAQGKFAELLASHQIVVLSDYGKGALGEIEDWIAEAQKRDIPVFVDPKCDNFARYRGAALLTPNLQEFERVVGAVGDDADMQEKAEELLARHEVRRLLVTLSERGMALFAPEEAPIFCEARAREVYDVSGAGDTVVAVMAMAEAAGLDARAALELASGAAGVVVSKLGAATVSREELAGALQL